MAGDPRPSITRSVRTSTSACGINISQPAISDFDGGSATFVSREALLVGAAHRRNSVSVTQVTTADVFTDADTKFKSHNLLATLTYNFGEPPPPPPPPPPPAAASAAATGDADVPGRLGDPGDGRLSAAAAAAAAAAGARTRLGTASSLVGKISRRSGVTGPSEHSLRRAFALLGNRTSRDVRLANVRKFGHEPDV